MASTRHIYDAVDLCLNGMPKKVDRGAKYLKFIYILHGFFGLGKISNAPLTTRALSNRASALRHWKEVTNRESHRFYLDIPTISKHPNMWGPFIWNMLFRISCLWTKGNSGSFSGIIKLLRFVLPCPKCAKGIHKILLKRGIKEKFTAINNRRKAVNFIFVLQDQVRVKLGKPQKEKRVPPGSCAKKASAFAFRHGIVTIDEKNFPRSRKRGCQWR